MNKNSYRMLYLGSAFVLGLSVVGNGAFAAPISCDTSDATANGATADYCAGDDALGSNPSSETTFVDGEWAPASFTYIGKYEFDESAFEAGNIAGFVLDVSVDPDYPVTSDLAFQYTLSVPTAYVGTIVDWVLGVKQGNNQFIAYLFEDVALGIDGGFNNFWINGGGGEVNDFSHASGWIREGSTPPTGLVPAPGVLGLFGLGLLGLGWVTMRSRARG